MTRNELHPSLRRPYSPGLPAGVERVEDPAYQNLWFVVPPAPPRILPRGLPAGALAKAGRLIEGLPAAARASELDRLISFLFVRREAVESSRMEGTFSTIDHVLTPGEIHDQREGKSERASVLGYANALETEFAPALKTGVSIFRMRLIKRLHQAIMSSDPHYQGRPGELREPKKAGAIVWIGALGRPENALYNPAPPRHVRRCLTETLGWLSDRELAEIGDAGMGIPLAVRMAVGHSHFEAVHPFPDGNGRVGRMLMTLQIACHGKLPIYVSGYIEAEKQEYSKALQQSQKKLNYGPIVEFIADALVSSNREAEKLKDRISRLPESWSDRGSFRAGSAAQRALGWLLANPILTARQLGESLQVSPPAANRALEQLVEAKIIRERTGKHWSRVFAAEEVVELLSKRFGDDPDLAVQKARDLLRVDGRGR